MVYNLLWVHIQLSNHFCCDVDCYILDVVDDSAALILYDYWLGIGFRAAGNMTSLGFFAGRWQIYVSFCSILSLLR